MQITKGHLNPIENYHQKTNCKLVENEFSLTVVVGGGDGEENSKTGRKRLFPALKGTTVSWAPKIGSGLSSPVSDHLMTWHQFDCKMCLI